jgi:hypothetical protein
MTKSKQNYLILKSKVYKDILHIEKDFDNIKFKVFIDDNGNIFKISKKKLKKFLFNHNN